MIGTWIPPALGLDANGLVFYISRVLRNVCEVSMSRVRATDPRPTVY